MVEEKRKPKKEEQAEKPKEKPEEKMKKETLVRIASTDIPGKTNVYAGLTKIKGISWALSNAICKSLNIDKNRKISSLTEQEIEKILAFAKNPDLPAWLLNRRKDVESGENKHLIATELDLRREFDIRRMKKIKSYKGARHTAGLPVRGQRTRAHFRKGKSIGVSRAKIKPGKKK